MTGVIFSQDVIQKSLMPSLNLNKSINERISLNFKAESRVRMSRLVTEKPRPLYYDLSDFSLMFDGKVGLGNVVSMGYLYRSRTDEHAHRLIQQFTIVRLYSKFRLAHRFASDQTLRINELESGENEDVAIRFRYRITAEIPLNGTRLDKDEFYLKLNNEYLNANIEDDLDLEVRFVPLLGYFFQDNNKIEAGLDYRADGILYYQTRHRMWLTFAWFIKV